MEGTLRQILFALLAVCLASLGACGGENGESADNPLIERLTATTARTYKLEAELLQAGKELAARNNEVERLAERLDETTRGYARMVNAAKLEAAFQRAIFSLKDGPVGLAMAQTAVWQSEEEGYLLSAERGDAFRQVRNWTSWKLHTGVREVLRLYYAINPDRLMADYKVLRGIPLLTAAFEDHVTSLTGVRMAIEEAMPILTGEIKLPSEMGKTREWRAWSDSCYSYVQDDTDCAAQFEQLFGRPYDESTAEKFGFFGRRFDEGGERYIAAIKAVALEVHNRTN